MSSFEGSRRPEVRQYIRVANWLREQIVGGQLPLGSKLPGEEVLKRTFGVDRSVIRRAVLVLRDEGLIVTRHGVGSFVAAVPDVRVAILRPGDEVTARLPHESERSRLGELSPGVPVLVIVRANGGPPEVYSAAVTVLHVRE